MEPRTELYFDGTAVQAVVSALTGSAMSADRVCRRALGVLEFGPRHAGESYRLRGAALEEGYRRLRRALDEWTAVTNRSSDAAARAADGYHDQEQATFDALRGTRTDLRL